MDIRTQVAAGIGVIVLVSGIAGALIFKGVSEEVPIEEQVGIESAIVRDHVGNMLSAVYETKTDVIQVQQFLSDVSATRGQDGYADGFENAEKFAKKFDQDIALATKHAQALHADNVLTVLKDVKEQFPQFYKTGIAMGHVYVTDGPAGGNKLMGQFDPMADAMDKALESALEEAHKISDKFLDHLVGVSDSLLQSSRSAIWTVECAIVVSLLFGVVLGGALTWHIRQRFIKLNADLNVISTRQLETPLQLRVERLPREPVT